MTQKSSLTVPEPPATPGALQTSSVAAMVTARAEVEARYIVALQRPRDLDTVRVRLLRSAQQPRLAQAGIYRVPVGGGTRAEGLSIRAAEEIHRIAGNLDVAKVLLHQDDTREVWRVRVTDLESNAAHSTDVLVSKQVERRRLKDGERPIGTRQNSRGEVVYLVQADETSMRRKRNSEMSRAKREGVLALTPAWILEDFEAALRETRQASSAGDPRAAIKQITDGFAGLGIDPHELAEYAGKPIPQLLPPDIEDLRGLYVALRDGDTTWAKAMATRRRERQAELETEEAAGSPIGDALDQVTAKLEAAAPPPPVADDSEPPAPSKAELLVKAKAKWRKGYGRELAGLVGADWQDRDWTLDERHRVWAQV